MSKLTKPNLSLGGSADTTTPTPVTLPLSFYNVIKNLSRKFFMIFTTLLLLVFTVNVYAGCNTFGMSDSYVLALSSEPGFCETYGDEAGKPECADLTPRSYQATHLILHGLWPNQQACGTTYGFCGVAQKKFHCSYSPLSLSADVAENLKKIMPSYNYGSCLERHEWNKHGSCQILSTDDYFSLAMRLTVAANDSVLGRYLTENVGKKIKLATLRNKVVEAFGKENSGKVFLGCKYGILVDIYIQLPALIPLDEPLESLVGKAPNPKYKDTCPSKITISNFNK